MIRLIKLLPLLVFGWARAAFAQDDAYALLIGVSEYPSLAAERQLRGPRNDVDTMRGTLRAMRPEWKRITVLADGVAGSDGLPTRVEIEKSLERLAHDVHAGDFVVVYFSGHGSQQPAAPDDTTEADGLDEIFLPRDIGRWDGKIGAVRNALTDNDVNRLLSPLLAAGAQVWAIFDTCHAGSMTRGMGALLTDSEVQRAVRPAELGVPLFSANTRRAVNAAAAGTPSWNENLIVFSAAQSDQSTPELPLPLGDPERVERGLFSFTLSQALRINGAATFAQLAESIATRYALLQRSAPTPVFEGILDRAPPFVAAGVALPALRTAPVRVSEPAMCSRAEKRAPCNQAAAPGDEKLRKEAALWLAQAMRSIGALQMAQPAGADVALYVRAGKVWFVSPSDDYQVGNRQPAFARDSATFQSNLRAIASVQRLFRLADRPAAAATLEVSMYRIAPNPTRGCGALAGPLTLSGAPQTLHAGDSLCMVIRNGGGHPLDVTLLHVGADYAIEPLYPLRGENNRLTPGAERRIAMQIVADDSPVLDRIVALASEASGGDRGGDIVDFSWLAQPGIESPTRGAAAATPARPLTVQALRWISAPAHRP